MIKKVKASLHEKLILIFLILLGIFALSFSVLVNNKCLFVKSFDPQILVSLYHLQENYHFYNIS